MNHLTVSSATAAPLRKQRLPAAARTILALVERLPIGILTIELPAGASVCGPGSDPQTAPGARLQPTSAALRATMRIIDVSVFDQVLKAGDIGLAESFAAGQWTTPDLSALLGLLLANRDHLDRLVYGSWWGSLWHRIRHRFNRNSRSGSERNIHAHYDLGNPFYSLWLDPAMNYSAALFDDKEPLAGQSLAVAQDAKLRHALKAAGVVRGSRVLEIGCGWGALAEMAAGEFGAEVKGVTLSREQLDWARERIQRAKLSSKCELVLQDYRDLPALHAESPFDAIIAIEMFEAVGREYWDIYFDTLRRCLKPGGLACIQTITIRDDLFDRYMRSTDFIQQYIFPGGLLPSDQAFSAQARQAGFDIVDRHAFGGHYAETLRRWQAAFKIQQAAVRGQGFDSRFVRLWEFYLAYCEAAFDQGNCNVVQYSLRRQ
jgi:cyclopropane-fatty-acyl-phospholipid synthase